jgi:hypothetical protein
MFQLTNFVSEPQQFERPLQRPLGNQYFNRRHLVRSALIVILSVWMGFLTACSNLRDEVIAGKTEAQQEVARTYVGHAKTHSLWAIGVNTESNADIRRN